MEDSKLRQLKYLLQSHEPWEPDKLVLQLWEAGLQPQFIIDELVKQSTTDIYVAAIRETR